MITVRRAELSDSELLCRLIAEAIEDLIYYMTGYSEEAPAFLQLLDFIRREDTRVSYRNCLVAEEDGSMLGAVLCYCGDDAVRLDEPLNRHLQSMGRDEKLRVECRAGELYVDAIAVLKQARGRGIAAQLLEGVCKRAREEGQKNVSLLVDLSKPRVQVLYERCGFCDDGLFTLAGHTYRRMVKRVGK